MHKTFLFLLVPVVQLLVLAVIHQVEENDSEANESDGAAATQTPLAEYGAGEEQLDEEPNEDEFALLERQAARGLSPKQLFSYLVQD
ncbi:hypothetical protein AWZ03_013442, partial [Drosophila navojoa]